MAAFSAPIDETSTLKLGNKLSYLLRHKFTFEYFVAALNWLTKFRCQNLVAKIYRPKCNGGMRSRYSGCIPASLIFLPHAASWSLTKRSSSVGVLGPGCRPESASF